MVMLAYGLGLIAAGLAALGVRGALEGLFVDSLAKTEAANVPAEHAWDIATSLLQSIATTVVIYGVLFVDRRFPRIARGIRGRDPQGDRTDAARPPRVGLVDLRGRRPDRLDHLAALRDAPARPHHRC